MLYWHLTSSLYTHTRWRKLGEIKKERLKMASASICYTIRRVSSQQPWLWPFPLCPVLPGSSLSRSSLLPRRAGRRLSRRPRWPRGSAASRPWSTIWAQVAFPWGLCPCICPPLGPGISCTCDLDKLCTACHQFPMRVRRKQVNKGTVSSLTF